MIQENNNEKLIRNNNGYKWRNTLLSNVQSPKVLNLIIKSKYNFIMIYSFKRSKQNMNQPLREQECSGHVPVAPTQEVVQPGHVQNTPFAVVDSCSVVLECPGLANQPDPS